MSFSIVTDSSCNLPTALIESFDLKIISLVFQKNGMQIRSYVKGQTLDLRPFYEAMRNKESLTTSSVAPQDCIDVFSRELEAGHDVLYIGFSSALSATYQTASSILRQLAEDYPAQKVVCVDSLAAALGQGLLVTYAVRLRDAGNSIEDTEQWLLENRLHLCHWFTVDDLFFLQRGGRVSKAAAIFGSMVGIKPVLHVDNEGRLVPVAKVRGRRASLDVLVERLAASAIDPPEQPIYIVHGDCEEDAAYVREQLVARLGVTDILIACLEPVIGCHAGPGTLAVFFLGHQR